MKAQYAFGIADDGRIHGLRWVRLATALCCACLAGPAVRAAEEVSASAPPPAAQAGQHQPALEQRITLMSAELGLDEHQRTELRGILLNQRVQIMQLWSDTSVPPASRVGATRVITQQTGDRIRALLNDEQKAKYNQPRKPHDAAAGPPARSVEDWMQATSGN